MAYVTPKTLTCALTLRKHSTSAERRLWEHLRGHRLNGHKFVRQLPIGPFIVDFACRARKLVVEIDGATHGDVDEVAYDARRTRFLTAQGWRVLRAQNEDVFKNLIGVCDTILLALEEAPIPLSGPCNCGGNPATPLRGLTVS